jgi:transcriptional regulator with XRE-family HTH domain
MQTDWEQLIEFGLRLKKLREAQGWSQSELARRAEMHPSSICNIENARQLPYPNQLKKISWALGVEIRYTDETRMEIEING